MIDHYEVTMIEDDVAISGNDLKFGIVDGMVGLHTKSDVSSTDAKILTDLCLEIRDDFAHIRSILEKYKISEK